MKKSRPQPPTPDEISEAREIARKVNSVISSLRLSGADPAKIYAMSRPTLRSSLSQINAPRRNHVAALSMIMTGIVDAKRSDVQRLASGRMAAEQWFVLLVALTGAVELPPRAGVFRSVHFFDPRFEDVREQAVERYCTVMYANRLSDDYALYDVVCDSLRYVSRYHNL